MASNYAKVSLRRNNSFDVVGIRITSIARVRDIDSRVNDRNVVTARSMQRIQELLPHGIVESNGIIVEIAVLIHVVYVSPRTCELLPSSLHDVAYHIVSSGIPNFS